MHEEPVVSRAEVQSPQCEHHLDGAEEHVCALWGQCRDQWMKSKSDCRGCFLNILMAAPSIFMFVRVADWGRGQGRERGQGVAGRHRFTN